MLTLLLDSFGAMDNLASRPVRCFGVERLSALLSCGKVSAKRRLRDFGREAACHKRFGGMTILARLAALATLFRKGSGGVRRM
jgi:hypothetical protein